MLKKMTPVRMIALSFIGLILIGSIFLSLPISNQIPTQYINHLFTAGSAACVTGLVTIVPCQQYTFFGQIVLIIIIQIGGLGFLSLLMLFYNYVDKQITLSNKIILQQALNISTFEGIGIYLKKIMQYTGIIEGLGWIALTIRFLHYFSFPKALWYGFFHSISAFCNAGFDLLGSSSLINYKYDIYINLIISLLIIAGGLGFIVFLDLEKKIKQGIKRNLSAKKIFLSFSLQTKIVLCITLFLIFGGMFIFFALEYNNTLKGISLPHKLLLSYFQSVTLRTAGFATMDYVNLYDATKIFMCIWMLIGGSPAGCAGGIKTMTIFVILASFISNLKGHDEPVVFNRRIAYDNVKIANNLLIISLFVVIVGVTSLSLSEGKSLVDLLFEVCSAFGTVGVTAGITSTLSFIGKLIIIVLMYIGRIGPITMALSLISNNKDSKITYASENILIG